MNAFASNAFACLGTKKTSIVLCCSNRKQAVARKLAVDLPTQFVTPRQMDWSIYSKSITFDDPLTTISGLLLYKVHFRSIQSVVYAFASNILISELLFLRPYRE